MGRVRTPAPPANPLLVARCSLLVERRQRRVAAFTMVELLTVIAIMVIVAAVSIPAFSALFASNNIIQAQNQITAAIAEARSMAIRERSQVALIFFQEPGHAGESAYAYEIASPGQAGGFTTSPVYFQLVPQQSVQFLPNGVYIATLVGAANSNGVNNADNGFAMPPQEPAAFTLNSQGQATGINYVQPNNTSWANSSTNQAAPLRAIVFDSSGHLVILNSMITWQPEGFANQSYLSGNTPIQWWSGDYQSKSSYTYDPTFSFFSPNNIPFGPSSPGFVLYEPANWPASAGDPGAYLAANGDVMIINTYTGNIIQ